MENRIEELKGYLVPGKRVHLVGIGGVSMRPLGLVLQGMGMVVTGSDMNASVSTDELIASGIRVSIGHSAENITGADCIIRTAAAHNDNPEIAAARSMGIPTFERAQAWGVIMQAYRNAVCINHLLHFPELIFIHVIQIVGNPLCSKSVNKNVQLMLSKAFSKSILK